MLDDFDQLHGGVEKEVLSKVLEAMRCGYKIRLSFQKNAHDIRQTKVSPYAIQVSDNSILLTGRSTVHRGLHEFNLEQVVQVDLIDEQYCVPPRLHRRWKVGSIQYDERNGRRLYPRMRQRVS